MEIHAATDGILCRAHEQTKTRRPVRPVPNILQTPRRLAFGVLSTREPHVALPDLHPALGLFVTCTHSRTYHFFRSRVRRIVAHLTQRDSAICEPHDACNDGTCKSNHAANADEQTSRWGRPRDRWDWGGCQWPLARLSKWIQYFFEGTGTCFGLNVTGCPFPSTVFHAICIITALSP